MKRNKRLQENNEGEGECDSDGEDSSLHRSSPAMESNLEQAGILNKAGML